MAKNIFIVLAAILFAGCATTMEMPPLDDAYHWPDKNAAVSVSSSLAQEEDTESLTREEGTESPAIEYVTIQDTTVTVKINR